MQRALSSASGNRGIRIAAILLWLLSLGQFINLAVAPTLHPEGYKEANHWDFHVYKGASDVVASGGNPLEMAQLEAVGVGIPYNYSPAFTRATSWFFVGDSRAVEIRFVVAKLLAVLGAWIVLAWGLRLRGLWIPFSAFLLLFGFGSAILVDMSAGNITAFELLWLSALLVGAFRRWDALFLPALFLLVLGKPLWGIFAVVPLALHWDRRGALSFGFGAATFTLPLLLSYLISPEQTRQYMQAAFGFQEHGYINPCWREFIGRFLRRGGAGKNLSDLVWLGSCVALLAFAVRARMRAGSGASGLALGSALMLMLPFLLPRFKPYAFVLLIPFVILSLHQGQIPRGRAALATFLSVTPFILRVDIVLMIALASSSLSTLLGYFPLYLTGAVLYLLVLGRRRTPSPVANRAT